VGISLGWENSWIGVIVASSNPRCALDDVQHRRGGLLGRNLNSQGALQVYDLPGSRDQHLAAFEQLTTPTTPHSFRDWTGLDFVTRLASTARDDWVKPLS
jgi:hypothetical protein